MTALTEAIYAELVDPVTGHYIQRWGVLLPWADATTEVVEEAMSHHHGDDHVRIISETQHLRYVPHIKWCERLDGFGCDANGEWHRHWEGVKHNPNAPRCCHTVALPIYADDETNIEEATT